MPRNGREPTQEEAAEYLAMESFMRAFGDLNVCGIHIDIAPVTELDDIDRTKFSTVSRGLQMAVNDCLQDSSDWPLEKVLAFDQRMRDAGIRTLSEVRRRHPSKLPKILERGRIRSEIEYYLVAGVLADCSDDLDDEQRRRLDVMADEYGRRQAAKSR